MPEITSHGPVNRHITEYLTTDKRVRQYRCKTLQNPDYFYTGSIYAPVDVAQKLDTATAKAGGIWLANKNIVSVGTKKTDDPYKLIGLRPDENQGGSEQFEISIESIEINGKPQTINLRDRLEISPITTKFGDNLYVQRARQRCRAMVLADNATDGFRIVFRMHLTGLAPVYRADLDEWWIYNGKGQFRFRLGRPYLIDAETMNPLDGIFTPMVKHSLAEVGPGEYLYIKEPTEAFGNADLPESFLIDADTVYSSTADGMVTAWSSSWATTRAAATGNSSSTSNASEQNIASAYYEPGWYQTYRGFYYFLTSSIAGTVTAVDLLIYGYFNNESDVCAQKGTQADSLTTADNDSFSGSLYGSISPWSKTGYNTIPFNATGCAEINQSGTTKICARNKAYDYDNVPPTGGKRCGGHMANYAGTDYDPYLFITSEAPLYTNILSTITAQTLSGGIDLPVIRSISGSISGQTAITDSSLSVLRPMIAGISAQANIGSADLSVLRLIAAAVSGQMAVSSLSLLQLISLASAINGQTLSGGIDLPVIRSISGSISGQTAITDSSLSVLRPMIAGISAQSNIGSADLSVLRLIAGAVSGQMAVSSLSLLQLISLASAINGQTLSGGIDLPVLRLISGAASGQTIITDPALSAIMALASGVTVQSNVASADLSVLRLISGALTGQTALTSPSLLSLIAVASAINAQSLSGGIDLKVLRSIIGSIAGQTAITDPALSSLMAVASAISGQALTADIDLSVLRLISGAISGQTSMRPVQLSQLIALTSEINAQSLLDSINLGLLIRYASVIAAVSDASGINLPILINIASAVPASTVLTDVTLSLLLNIASLLSAGSFLSSPYLINGVINEILSTVDKSQSPGMVDQSEKLGFVDMTDDLA